MIDFISAYDKNDTNPDLDATLSRQMTTLDHIFKVMLVRASDRMYSEHYLFAALRAQALCRATAEALRRLRQDENKTP